MMKKVLLFAPPFMELYKNIISEIERQGYSVTYVEDKSYSFDPYCTRIKKQNHIKSFLYDSYLFVYWLFHNRKIFCDYYDTLLVINGTSFHPLILKMLHKKNNNIHKVLYLWDRTYLSYRFDRIFRFFDKVATFDKVDSKVYGISFLPNYWMPEKEHSGAREYSFFAFGAYRKDRCELFKKVKEMAVKENLCHYIFIYVNPPKNGIRHKCKIFLRKFGLKRLSIEELISDNSLISYTPLQPSEFNEMIYKSKCIVDTNNVFQEGMTPRFMWALGANCKIITTNKNAANYDFFDESRILLADESLTTEKIKRFIDMPIQNDISNLIVNYRLDNWIKFLID